MNILTRFWLKYLSGIVIFKFFVGKKKKMLSTGCSVALWYTRQ